MANKKCDNLLIKLFSGKVLNNMRYGIVYMGSKEKILYLIQYLLEREYQAEYMIDLFCGGFSVSSYALQNSNKKVIANDLNHYVIDLYDKLLNNDPELKTKKFEWISREKFNDVRDNPQNYPAWFVGFVLNVYSFGCNQKDYLYAKDIEENKRAIHQAIVYDDFSLMEQNELFKGFKIREELRKIDYKLHPNKRIAFMRVMKNFILENKDNDKRKELERLTQMENISQMEHLSAISRNQLNKSRLQLHSEDYLELYNKIPKDILEKSFIYCDPPYENTKQYQFGQDFDYDKFWDWFRNCPYSVYASSYTAPDDIKTINFDYKLSLLDNGKAGDNKPKKKVVENIYWNGKGNPVPTFYDMLFNKENKS